MGNVDLTHSENPASLVDGKGNPSRKIIEDPVSGSMIKVQNSEADDMDGPCEESNGRLDQDHGYSPYQIDRIDHFEDCTCPEYVIGKEIVKCFVPGVCELHKKTRIIDDGQMHFSINAETEDGREVCFTVHGDNIIELAHRAHDMLIAGELWIKSCVGWKIKKNMDALTCGAGE